MPSPISMSTAPDSVLHAEIKWARDYAEKRGGVDALAIEDYEHDPAAFCARMRTALPLSAQLHHHPELLPVLTATDLIYLPAVRVERGWEVLDAGVWRLVAAEPELLGDGEDEDGGRVQLLLADVGTAVYRRGERVWARDRAKYQAILATLDETAGPGEDGDG